MVHFSPLFYTVLHCSLLCCTVLYYCSLHCIAQALYPHALPCTVLLALHCTTTLHCPSFARADIEISVGPPSASYTLHPAHWKQCTAHHTLRPTYCTLHNAHYIRHTTFCKLHTTILHSNISVSTQCIFHAESGPLEAGHCTFV